jgi:hypothetical protein
LYIIKENSIYQEIINSFSILNKIFWKLKSLKRMMHYNIINNN